MSTVPASHRIRRRGQAPAIVRPRCRTDFLAADLLQARSRSVSNTKGRSARALSHDRSRSCQSACQWDWREPGEPGECRRNCCDASAGEERGEAMRRAHNPPVVGSIPTRPTVRNTTLKVCVYCPSSGCDGDVCAPSAAGVANGRRTANDSLLLASSPALHVCSLAVLSLTLSYGPYRRPSTTVIGEGAGQRPRVRREGLSSRHRW
jgi:hypothetical protein